MNITMIGSTAYQDRMKHHAKKLREDPNNDVFIPAFDDHPELDELGICAYNLFLIEKADEIHVFWDGRSQGTIFDLGMCFALRKKLKVIYLNDKTFRNVLVKYAEFCRFIAETPQDQLDAMIKGEISEHDPIVSDDEPSVVGNSIPMVQNSDVVLEEQTPTAREDGVGASLT